MFSGVTRRPRPLHSRSSPQTRACKRARWGVATQVVESTVAPHIQLIHVPSKSDGHVEERRLARRLIKLAQAERVDDQGGLERGGHQGGGGEAQTACLRIRLPLAYDRCVETTAATNELRDDR